MDDQIYMKSYSGLGWPKHYAEIYLMFSLTFKIVSVDTSRCCYPGFISHYHAGSSGKSVTRLRCL